MLLRAYQSTITNRKHATQIQWDNFLWPLANGNPDFKIHRIFKSDALAFGLLPEVTLCHSVNNRPVKRLPLVARLPPAFYIVLDENQDNWDKIAGTKNITSSWQEPARLLPVRIMGWWRHFYNSKLGRRLKCWPTWPEQGYCKCSNL